MNHLLRSLAPITARAWELLDEEARRQLAVALASRRLVDFSGPHGWDHSATNLGRTEPVPDVSVDGVFTRRRLVLPVVEQRAPSTVSLEELAGIDRGAEDPDLDELGEAARRIAVAENAAVLGEVAGASPHEPIATSWPQSNRKSPPRRLTTTAPSTPGAQTNGPPRICRRCSNRG